MNLINTDNFMDEIHLFIPSEFIEFAFYHLAYLNLITKEDKLLNSVNFDLSDTDYYYSMVAYYGNDVAQPQVHVNAK